MNPDDLEHLIDRELKQLPVPRAPETLLPRVLAATAGRKPTPSYAAPWLDWSRRRQLASVAVLVLIAAGVGLLGHLGWLEVVARLSWLGSASGTVTRVAAAAEDGATLVRACWRVLLGPVTFSLLVVALSLSLACAALWAALDRIAMGGASEP
jgi:hypothetical protein